MNCPSRVDPEIPPDWNQNPPALAADTTTCNDLNHIANERQKRKNSLHAMDDGALDRPQQPPDFDPGLVQRRGVGDMRSEAEGSAKSVMRVDIAESPRQPAAKHSSSSGALETTFNVGYTGHGNSGNGKSPHRDSKLPGFFVKIKKVLYEYSKFIGPGFMVAVAYIDPGELNPWRTPPHSLLLRGSTLTISRQLCNGRCCWRFVPLQASFHYPDVQRFRHLPAVPMRKAWNRYGHEPSRKLPCTSAKMA